MQLPIRKKKKKPLSHRRGLPTFRAEKRSGLELIKLLVPVLPSVHQLSSSLKSSEV